MNQRTYKIRSFSNGKNRRGQPFVNYSLTIPSHIAEKLPRDIQFYCELTGDGLLFRPVPPGEEQIELPPWAANGEAEKPKRAARKRPTSKAATSKSKPRSKPRSRPQTKAAQAEPEPEQATEQAEPEQAEQTEPEPANV